ncbi:MAG: sodium:alanine symporter family protein [Oscillospiraceae bacterium]|nr:sodium:alanine symporter family protein [Oscillospiraceae bacterium]
MFLLIEGINRVVWGPPTLILILIMGTYLTVRMGFVQLRLFPRSVRKFFALSDRQNKTEGTSSFQALCTALAATVGTGNLAGVAGAIAIGGPGTIFWMWVFAFLGMATKFAEATLAVRFRQRNSSGEYVGGPMYMIRSAMPKKLRWLAGVYSFFGVVAAFGVGNATQINTVISSIRNTVSVFGGSVGRGFELSLGIPLAILIMWMLHKGATGIGKITEYLVPLVAFAYIVICVVVLWMCADRILPCLGMIVTSAFSPAAATGGVVGSAIVVIRTGASRGVFTNEAGMGTASIAHAAAKVAHPCEQGLMGIMEVFLDTIVICTLTALVILCSGIAVPYGKDVGVQLTNDAFCQLLGPWSSVFLSATLSLLALATVLGWGVYGARCAQYLFGENVWKTFVILQGVTVVVGSVLGTGAVWILAETVNGLMAIPNLIALAYLSPELLRLTKEYKTASGICRKPQRLLRQREGVGRVVN